MRRVSFWSVMAATLMVGTLTAAAQPPKFSAPKDFVLALGDSLTFGFQEAKFLVNPDPSNFDTGFVDDFVRRLRTTSPGQDARVVNFGCPGETTLSFLTACDYHAVFGLPLHDNFSGSQIDAAERFLADHPGQVGPILVSLGANDVLALVTACGGQNVACIEANLPNLLAALVPNYEQILIRLRSAAPDAEIIALTLYNPFAILDPVTNAESNGFTAIINQALEALAAAHRVRVADPLVAFDLTPPQPARLCSLILLCGGGGDVHPSDAGYQVIADIVWASSGFARFEDGARESQK